jgi:hypothetical protein
VSLAAKRSHQGDEYQLQVAMHWLIRMLAGEEPICGVQADSTGIPGEEFLVSVDDIVILYESGHKVFVQAKKNQTDHNNWTFADKVLQAELCNARDQIEVCSDSTIIFYSRSPFGELKSLVEHCKNFPDYAAFSLNPPEKQKEYLKKLSEILARPEDWVFMFSKRLGFGRTNEFADWQIENNQDISKLVSRADIAIDALERFIGRNQASSVRDPKHIFTRKDLIAVLEVRGIFLAPNKSASEILEIFKRSSAIGRNWLRTIGGTSLPRQELEQVIGHINRGERTILIEDRSGSGKTCLLLDLADRMEAQQDLGLLFIKGDLFADISSEDELAKRGMPTDIVGLSSRLAEHQHVVVVIDSLDVLSLGRSHSALKVFLGLIDRLEKVEGVTIVVACRTFDLNYDPLLRRRSWKSKICLGLLDFESTVMPLLQQWGIDTKAMNQQLKELLRTPQNLRLFERIAKHGITSQPITSYELRERYLEESVLEDERLGTSAMDALQRMAEYLVQKRLQEYPRSAFTCSEEAISRLVSGEVLQEATSSSLTFSHSTLGDCLVVQTCLAKGETLEQFILKHPQLPYLRPAVRVFFFHLHTQSVENFCRQVWEAISNPKISYHVKRLMCESLAEIEAGEKERRLLRRIFQQEPDLFRSLMNCTKNISWFQYFRNEWLLYAKASTEREQWLLRFLWKLRHWIKEIPSQIVEVWNLALNEQWAAPVKLADNLIIDTQDFKDWQVDGTRYLLEKLFESGSQHLDMLGESIAEWVDANDSGDDFLWKYITTKVEDADSLWEVEEKLLCGPSILRNRNFLEKRLSHSTILLDLAINDLLRWEARGCGGYPSDRLLEKTSWMRKHSSGNMLSVDGLFVLLQGVEAALKLHAKANDSWWLENESRLREADSSGPLYLLIQSYLKNPSANIQVIEQLMLSDELFKTLKLTHEAGDLLYASFPFLSASSRSNIQQNILSLNAPEQQADEWDKRRCEKLCLDLLKRIPSCLRLPESQLFIDEVEPQFEVGLPEPYLYSSGGFVSYPVSVEQILSLSDTNLLRLLEHYNRFGGEEDVFGGWRGGSSEIKAVLREAASLSPLRFLRLFEEITHLNDENSHADAVLNGISNHLIYQFGNTKPNGVWKPSEPIPDSQEIAEELLQILERYAVLWKEPLSVSHALEACSYILCKPEQVERLVLLMAWLRNTPKPEPDRIAKSSHELRSIAINSPRGVLAEAAVVLCNKLLELECPLPELLPYLLMHFARDPANAVRVQILLHLPFSIYKSPKLGWDLLAQIFEGSCTNLWTHAERSFYLNYQDNFSRVKPYLERLRIEGLSEAGESWGRIATLAHLAGHITREELFATLCQENSSALWTGVTQVFSANIGERNHTTFCHEGILRVLGNGILTHEVVRSLDDMFEAHTTTGVIRPALAVAFINALPRMTRRLIKHFLDWIGIESRRDPLSALDLLERLVEKMEQMPTELNVYHTKPLIAALDEILREADETNDHTLISHAISLQDQFLKLDVGGIEEFFSNAG